MKGGILIVTMTKDCQNHKPTEACAQNYVFSLRMTPHLLLIIVTMIIVSKYLIIVSKYQNPLRIYL
jgi:hypothetical protein